MFSHCKGLKSLDLSNFNTENVENMKYMFCYCNNLDYLNLSSFNTEKVTNIENIFFECKKNIFEFNK